jgi:pyruvyltransferase
MINAYWWPAKNFGDTLSPIILKYFTKQEIKLAGREEPGKLLAVGSILHLIKPNDTVWGSGLNRRRLVIAPPGAKFLAVRGPITRRYIKGNVPQIYGDPGILLPLIYNPKIEKKFEYGIVPHYVDKPFIKLRPGDKYIDIQGDWKKVVDEMLSCKKIVSSSLHGIICAEAYGIPAIWTRYSTKITGGSMKYNDYFLGSGRGVQKYFTEIPPIKDLDKKQKVLIDALMAWIK